ncbi:TOMM precursor leader peptide-binding protein, partial [Streptomyces sp. NPDC054826]
MLPAAADRPLPEVAVRALGVEDAFGAPAGQPSDGRAAPAGAVPVHLYGHHVIVGPWPDGDRPGCGTCLRRRWQSVRSVGLREGLELRGGTREAGPWPHLVPFAAQAVAALIASPPRAPARDPRAPVPPRWGGGLQRLTGRHPPM